MHGHIAAYTDALVNSADDPRTLSNIERVLLPEVELEMVDLEAAIDECRRHGVPVDAISPMLDDHAAMSRAVRAARARIAV